MGEQPNYLHDIELQKQMSTSTITLAQQIRQNNKPY